MSDLKFGNTSEEKALYFIARFMCEEVECEAYKTEYGLGSGVLITGKKIRVLMTICDTNNGECLKIEEIKVAEKYRKTGVMASFIDMAKNASEFTSARLGLWCDINNKDLLNWYLKQGFQLIEVQHDYWLELNPKKK